MGDKIERILPGKGRIMCAQFSSFMAVPTSFFLLILLLQDAHKWALFAEIFLLMGLPSPGVNHVPTIPFLPKLSQSATGRWSMRSIVPLSYLSEHWQLLQWEYWRSECSGMT